MKRPYVPAAMKTPPLSTPLTYYPHSKSLIMKRISDELNIGKTVKLNELRLKLSQFLSNTKNNGKSGTCYIDQKGGVKRGIGREQKMGKKQRNELSKITNLLEERRRKKEKQEEEDENIKSIYRKTFTIKQIHPSPKSKLTKKYIFENRIDENLLAHYYKILNIKGKIQNGPLYKSQRNSNIFSQHKGQNEKDSREKLKEEGEGEVKSEERKEGGYDGGTIEPWKYMEENIIDQINQS